MKLKRIMIIAIFLLALVTLGVASAADENMTELQTGEDIESSSDVLAQEDSIDDNQSIESSDDGLAQENLTDDNRSIESVNTDSEFSDTLGAAESSSDDDVLGVFNYWVDIKDYPKYFGDPIVECEFPEDATGTLIFIVDGKKITYDVGKYIFYDVPSDFIKFYKLRPGELNLTLGKHTVTVKYKGNLGSFSRTQTVYVGYTIPFSTYYEGNDWSYGKEHIINFWLPNENGSFKVTVNGKPFNKFTRNCDYPDQIDVDISEFCGDVVVGVEYAGDAKFNYPVKVYQTYRIVSHFRASINNIGYRDNDGYISLSLPEDAKGNLVVEVDGKVYAKESFKYGKAKVLLNNLSWGTHSLKAYYDGDEYTNGIYYYRNGEENAILEDEITIEPQIKLSSNEITYNESVDVYINLPEGSNGTLLLKIGSKTYTAEVVNDTAKITFSNLVMGYYHFTAIFNGTDGLVVKDYLDLKVAPIYNISDFVVFGSNIISVTTPMNFNGTLVIWHGGVYRADIVNGHANISFPDLSAGWNHFECYLWRNDNKWAVLNPIDVHVAKATYPKLIPSVLSVYYTNYYIVKAIDVDGSPLKNAKIYFTIGNLTFKRYTDWDGQAILKMAYKPKTYTVVAQYSKKVKLTERVKVVGVVSFKAVTVKKSAKSLTLVASLKKGKKAIKYAKVYFTFNGKTYKAVTSKKGYAILTIPKADLNRVKVGRTVAYQAAYGKNVVKYTAKVRR